MGLRAELDRTPGEVPIKLHTQPRATHCFSCPSLKYIDAGACAFEYVTTRL